MTTGSVKLTSTKSVGRPVVDDLVFVDFGFGKTRSSSTYLSPFIDTHSVCNITSSISLGNTQHFVCYIHRRFHRKIVISAILQLSNLNVFLLI